ncbi:PaaI family thioesterase [Yinghuangia seranimata]|uniref:PaaI family thioesterase n=1 Tax=Yinghuangia seranimata TaxID=408067 RepID=UPI00248B9B1C|nr:PaaI family thioesterase [Yinghuangia seranimata]MDI2128714.1 PaaI family thioesterase [Yinghuangia seranimata]
MSRPSSLSPSPGTSVPGPHPSAPPPGTELGEHYDGCFGCGEELENGLKLRTRVGEGVSVDTEFVVGTGHQGAPGLAHGGLLSCAFDEALGALGYLLHTPAVTARLETDFRMPVPVGSTLYIHAWCTGVDGRKIYAKAVGRLDAPDGPVAVEAASLFIAVGFEHFVSNGRAEDVERAMANPDVIKAARAFEVNP